MSHTADNTEVICPKCTHQFRAIPAQVQKLLLQLGAEPPFLAATPTRTEFEAAAYRWLRDGGNAEVLFKRVERWGTAQGDIWSRMPGNDELDTAISAAMGWPTVPEVKS